LSVTLEKRLLVSEMGIDFVVPHEDFWAAAYFLLGTIFLVGTIYYIAKTWEETFSNEFLNNLQGQKSSQIAYITALIVKTISLFVTGIFLVSNFTTKETSTKKCFDPEQTNCTFYTYWEKYSVIPTGIPGYVSAITYCVFFFSWCSIAKTNLEKSVIGYYTSSKWALVVMNAFIVIGAIISISMMAVSNPDRAHSVEAIIASIRDIGTALCFGIYFFCIFKLFDSPCTSINSPEARLFSIIFVLIVALILRPVSIIIYVEIFSTGKRNEFSYGYFIIFLIEFIITEALPLATIAFVRLHNTDSYSSPDDNVAAFLALD
jgi:hypothetical protein